MTRLWQLHDPHGQSPWLDNLNLGDLTGGRLGRLVARGVRGVPSNPTIIAKAIGGSGDYDRQLAALAASGHDAEASY
jgi:transaldolase